MTRQPLTINMSNNATGLSLAERELAIDVLRSFMDSIATVAHNNREWFGVTEARALAIDSVYKAAMRQLRGQQVREGDVFNLVLAQRIQDADLAYLAESFGVSQENL